MKFLSKLFYKAVAKLPLPCPRSLFYQAAAALLVLAFLSACSSSDEEVPFYPIPAGMELVWSDEFDYEGAPDPEKWSYSLGANGWGNDELQCYTDSRANSWVKDGSLFIEATSDDGEWTSARLKTQKTAAWTYGYFEIRAKLAQGAGIWSALWMLPQDDIYGRWPRSGEIGIAEHAGSDASTICHSAYTESFSEDGARQASVSRVRDAANDFHSYAVEWSPAFMRWLVDGRETFFFENDRSGSESWPFDIPFYLILNVAVGGNRAGGEGEGIATESAIMEVDYVRVYQRAETERIE